MKGGDTRARAAAAGKKVGRPPKRREPVPESIATGKTGIMRSAELIEALNSLPPKGGDSIEIAGWRRFWDAMNMTIAFDARRYLYDKRDGKATQPVNHNPEDKPAMVRVLIEHIGTRAAHPAPAKAR